jgi:hypothetical protein
MPVEGWLQPESRTAALTLLAGDTGCQPPGVRRPRRRRQHKGTVTLSKFPLTVPSCERTVTVGQQGLEESYRQVTVANLPAKIRRPA